MKEKRWKPEDGEKFWCFDCFGCVGEDVYCQTYDDEKLEFGNCFKTEEEAEAAAEKVKALLLSLQQSCNQLATNLQDKKLPEWCKVGEWVWDDRNGYGEVKSVRDDRSACYIEFKGGGGDFVPEAFAKLKEVRLMNYDYQSIAEALGKAVSNDSAVGLVTGYDIATVRVFGRYIPFNVFRGMFRYLDGSPCGVLEHLENGEWVK